MEEGKNMIKEIIPPETLEKYLKSIPFSPGFPPASDRTAWEKIKTGILQKNWLDNSVSEAEKLSDEPWPDCSLKLFTLFLREGDRLQYEKHYFARRHRLVLDVLAECSEHKGRFIGDIAEGVWHIISEPTWALPAHEKYNGADPVPVEAELAGVDIFASDTGLLFALIVQLLEKEMREYSSSLVDRMRNNVVRRIILPIEAGSPWWLSCRGKSISNWVPWCCSNALGSILTFLKDSPDRQGILLRELISAVDRFIESYPPDGACDEGPMYWNLAVGQMFLFAEQLDKRTGGAYREFFQQTHIRKMGEYIAQMNLCSYYFLNPADAISKLPHFSPGMLLAYGRRSASPMLQSFASEYAFGMNPEKPEPAPGVFRLDRDIKLACMLYNLFELPENIRPEHTSREPVTWFADRQIFIARQNPEKTNLGTIAAIKGGDNAEGHNHNDVGQFSIYLNGRPIIVDPGIFSYSRKTFSDERYTLWWISGQGHNASSVNGNWQQPGEAHKAKLLRIDTRPEQPSVVFELSGIYPESAGVAEYVRSFGIDRKSGAVTVTDLMRLKDTSGFDVAFDLYSPECPEWENGKRLRWNSMSLVYDNIECVNIAEVPLNGDSSMMQSWGQLFRISFSGNFSGATPWKLLFIPTSL